MSILYLSGAIRPEVALDQDIGYMLTPQMGNRPDLSTKLWGADNGCFAQPQKFNGPAYLKWLGERPTKTCLFATAPDVLGDAVATLNRSLPYFRPIRALGHKAALVAQDGLEKCTVPWSHFDVLFLGGSTEWKLGPEARALVAQANLRGKWVHMGRVNSFRRLAYAQDIGCDSADGTYLAFGPDINLPKLRSWLRSLNVTEVAA